MWLLLLANIQGTNPQSLDYNIAVTVAVVGDGSPQDLPMSMELSFHNQEVNRSLSNVSMTSLTLPIIAHKSKVKHITLPPLAVLNRDFRSPFQPNTS